jgi:very-short-patch-repair endonuclease
MKYQDYTQQQRAKAMRREPTEAEAILWKALRARDFLGLKFRRQVAFGPFIADFYCAESKLIIEADGSQHADNVEYDSKRTEFFTSQGIRVMRFWNNEIIQNLDGVLTIITAKLQGETSSPSPSHASRGPLPLPHGERVL